MKKHFVQRNGGIDLSVEGRETIRSIKRAFQILECFTGGKLMLSIGELAELTALNKTTIFRVLSTLTELGYVQQDSDSGKYQLSWKLYHVGKATVSGVKLRSAALPLMQELCTEINETIGLNIIVGYERLRVEAVESDDLVRYVLKVGERYPLLLGATGRVMLAYLPKAEQEKAIAFASQNDFFQNRNFTLQEELSEIRQKGYAVGLDEGIVGAFSLAAPIFDHVGKIAGSINASGPIQRWTGDRIPYLTSHVVSTARRISEELGYVDMQKEKVSNLKR